MWIKEYLKVNKRYTLSKHGVGIEVKMCKDIGNMWNSFKMKMSMGVQKFKVR